MTNVLDVDAFHSGIDQTKKKVSSQEAQIKQLQTAVKGIVGLDDTFKGEGGEAIRFFYEKHHLPLMSSYSAFLANYQTTLDGMKKSLDLLEPSSSGFISQTFLEQQLEQDLTRAKDRTNQMVNETNSTMDGVADIVGLPKLNDTSFAEMVEKARTEKNQTRNLLGEFDYNQESALTKLEQELETVLKKVTDLQNLFQPAHVKASAPGSVQNWTCEKPVNAEVKEDKNLLQIIGDVFVGIVEGIVNFIKDLIVGLFELLIAIFTDLPGLLMGIINALINYDKTIAAMIDAFLTAWDRDVMNGDARSISRFFTYEFLSIAATFFIGGIDKVSKAGNLSKLGKLAAKNNGPDGIPAKIPYNVMDTTKLKAFMQENLIKHVEHYKKSVVDFVQSNLFKTVIHMKNLSSKVADIFSKTRNVLNPEKVNKILQNTYDNVVKGPLGNTKKWLDQKINDVLDKPIPSLVETLGPNVPDTLRDVLGDARESVSGIITSTNGKIRDEAKLINNDKDIKDITKLTVDDIPTAKSGNFNKFFNSLTKSELDELWKEKKIRKKIERQLREPGGLHEWHLVSRAPQFKYWNISAEEIKDLRTAISDVKFVNPNGIHGGLGSTKAHNELLAIIDTSSDYNTFVRRLNNWANYRLEGGVMSLPKSLRLK
ncbi:LXG domain-containing protein [Metabacillus sp. KIGAM252]|uniref:LXG domain-containing protein n=1 Tax=Metabacillus flavus TaxID=2823519 RepID=A0ABS5LIU0_9BACI|nr:LXG domain-containing protein [Metabacillus flavus]MBS2970661.1 LXG domain-containing protein [Metabacillus flavus]